VNELEARTVQQRRRARRQRQQRRAALDTVSLDPSRARLAPWQHDDAQLAAALEGAAGDVRRLLFAERVRVGDVARVVDETRARQVAACVEHMVADENEMSLNVGGTMVVTTYPALVRYVASRARARTHARRSV
jgi:hypothetical protein